MATDNKPLVSVIMNCYNSSEYLREAIDSVFSQTYKNWEIIFWDNQSTDQSAEIFKSYSDERCKYFYAPSHTKLGEARDLAIRKANGEFIAILDADDIWLSDKLEKQISLMKKLNCGLLYSNALMFYPDGRIKLYSKNKNKIFQQCYKNLGMNYDICISTVIFKREILGQLSYIFDLELEVSEEADLFLRISVISKIYYSSDVSARYRVYKKSDSWKKSEKFISDADRIYKMHTQFNYEVEHLRGIFDSAYWVAAISAWMNSENIRAYKFLRKTNVNFLRKMVMHILLIFPYKYIAWLLKLSGKKVF